MLLKVREQRSRLNSISSGISMESWKNAKAKPIFRCPKGIITAKLELSRVVETEPISFWDINHVFFWIKVVRVDVRHHFVKRSIEDECMPGEAIIICIF